MSWSQQPMHADATNGLVIPPVARHCEADSVCRYDTWSFEPDWNSREDWSDADDEETPA